MPPPPPSNLTPGISSLMARRLLSQPDHPLAIIQCLIHASFPSFTPITNLSPIVTTQQCFDDLLIPKDHVSRRPSDTFYLDDGRILRTHTSAHQTELLRQGHRSFLVSGDVYRRDAIDASHFPAFHQMEGVCVMPPGTSRAQTFENLKDNLSNLASNLFGKQCERRWVDTTFPFTDPSTEMEIKLNKDWLEVLGCGVVHPAIMDAVGLSGQSAWAFGLGLERLAMILFDIPDIRLFWSSDPRFTLQFKDGLAKLQTGTRIKFKPYSKYPSIRKDLSFWIDPVIFHENDFFSIVREISGSDVESVTLLDSFEDGKSHRHSRTFRFEFRSMDRNLTHDEVNEHMSRVRDQVEKSLQVQLR